MSATHSLPLHSWEFEWSRRMEKKTSHNIIIMLHIYSYKYFPWNDTKKVMQFHFDNSFPFLFHKDCKSKGEFLILQIYETNCWFIYSLHHSQRTYVGEGKKKSKNINNNKKKIERKRKERQRKSYHGNIHAICDHLLIDIIHLGSSHSFWAFSVFLFSNSKKTKRKKDLD